MLIPADWRVPEQFGKRLGDTAGRQRAMLADGHLLLILHEPPTPRVPERTAKLFWRDPSGAWKAKPGPPGIQALKQHVAEFGERVDALEARWADASTAQGYYDLLLAIAPLHRSVRNLHTTLQQAREMVPDDRDLLNLRDQVVEIERAIELLHGDVRNGLDFTVARQAEEQTERSYEMAVSAHRLNLLAALFFPIATISAVFGMNLSHGLVGGGPATFWTILAASLVCGLFLAQAIAKKPRPSDKKPPRGDAGTPRRLP